VLAGFFESELLNQKVPIDSLDLIVRLFQSSRCVDGVVCKLELLLNRELGVHPGNRRFFVQLIAAHQARYLKRPVAGDHNQPVIHLIAARLDHECRIHNNDAARKRMLQLEDPPKDLCPHVLVRQPVERLSLFFVKKDDLTELFTIYVPIGRDDLLPESMNNCMLRPGPEREQLMRDKICINNMSAEFSKNQRCVAFSGRNVSREPDMQHGKHNNIAAPLTRPA
jgi:hypothetical protein